MSITSEIQRIQGAKSSIKDAIEAKGVAVPSATKIDGYATLVAQIPTGSSPNLQTLNVTPSTSAQHITPTSPVDGYNVVNVAAVTAGIDSNISAGNIKKNVTILGVTGNYEGAGSEVLPATLPVESTTVRYDATHTENIASNDHIRILGSDNQRYTLAQWNAMFVAAGFNKDNMPVSPKGLSVDALDHAGECYLFDIFTGQVYEVTGATAYTANCLQHSIFNQEMVTGAGSGTDFTTQKGWSVTANGDFLTLYEANTKQSWTINKNTGIGNALKSYNIEERTHSLWAQTEWMRHRMAISSGISTTKADGTLGEIEIFNSSGVQAAVGEDMYFWIKNDSNVWVNTNILAKYNVNNRHKTNSASLTAAHSTAIYTKQVAAGINMNDTGVNSSSKHILSPGAKGAEIIAVDGVWMIITPYLSNPSNGGNTYNLADAPAVYWAVGKGCSLPSGTLILAMYYNIQICSATVTYLNNREGWGLSTIPTGTFIWTSMRKSVQNAWYIYIGDGSVANAKTTDKNATVGALYLPE